MEGTISSLEGCTEIIYRKEDIGQKIVGMHAS
jgi:hypothetical protein